MNWLDKDQVKKGNLCEKLIREHLESKGYIVYRPKTDGPHLIDFFAARGSDNVEILFADAKGKAKRTKYNDTGIDKKHFESYKKLMDKTNSPVFLYFIDETPSIESIYGNFLSSLVSCGIKSWGNIIYFDCFCMRHVSRLPKDIALRLRDMSKRNYPYWLPSSVSDHELVGILRGEEQLSIF